MPAPELCLGSIHVPSRRWRSSTTSGRRHGKESCAAGRLPACGLRGRVLTEKGFDPAEVDARASRFEADDAVKAICTDGGSCTFIRKQSVPLSVPPGTHRLGMADRVVRGSGEATVTCAASDEPATPRGVGCAARAAEFRREVAPGAWCWGRLLRLPIAAVASGSQEVAPGSGEVATPLAARPRLREGMARLPRS